MNQRPHEGRDAYEPPNHPDTIAPVDGARCENVD